MATTNNKRTNNNRTSGSRSRSTGSGNNRKPNKNTKAYAKMREQERLEAQTPPENKREIYTIVVFAINLILLLGSFGVCGKVGDAVSGFFFGLFGFVFYVLPIVFFVAFCFLMANGPKPKLVKKLIWITVFFLSIAFICQLIAGTKGVGIKELYFDGYSDHRGGGILFGGLAVLIAKFLSRVGAVIISILLLIVSIIEITNIRLSEVFKKLFSIDFTNHHVYDEDYEYEDDYEDDDEDMILEKVRGKDILGSIKVLEKEEESQGSSKGKKKKRENVIVPEEEVHEIVSKEKPRDFFALEPHSDTYSDPLGSDTTYDSENGRVSQKTRSRKRPSPSERDVKPVTTDASSESSYDSAFDDSYDNAFDSAPMPARESAPQPQPEVEKVTKDDTAKATQEIGQEISNQTQPKKKYTFPPMSLLKSGGRGSFNRSGDTAVRDTAITLKQTLESFGVKVAITNCSVGPSITRYELQPEQGVRVNRIVALENDIKLALAATDIRIEAPIPGKSSIGIEIPNRENQTVYFRDLIDNDVFARFKSNVAFAVGKDISGQIIIHDIAKMPHVLIAGATGSGKSVCINTLIMSILYKSSPENVRMIMVDPKMVELTAYNGIPHLLIPVVTDPKKAAGALNWAVDEMTKRYQLFANYNVRNLEGFNKKVKEQGPNEDPMFKHMYQLVVIVDELADLMMVAHKEVEDSIVRLSQLARAAGIHLVIATQRPSVDVITGLIKANVPSRIAFAVSSGVDSRTIIDMVGAEKLLGKGDMLFYPTGYTKPVRVQGAFIDDDEVVSVVEFIKEHYGETSYDETVSKSIDSSNVGGGAAESAGGSDESSRYDEYFEDAARFVIEKDKASIGYLQRMLRIGFNRAARIMDQLEEFGVVGPEEGTKPRKILMNMSEFEDRLDSAQ